MDKISSSCELTKSYQRYNKQEQPDIDKEVVATHLDDVDQQRCDRYGNHHGNKELLDLVLNEEPWSLKNIAM